MRILGLYSSPTLCSNQAQNGQPTILPSYIIRRNIFFHLSHIALIEVAFFYFIQSTHWSYFILIILFCIYPGYGIIYHWVVKFVFVLIFLGILYFFTEIYLRTLHYLPLGCNPYWGSLFCIFIDLLVHCCHTHWHEFKIVN